MDEEKIARILELYRQGKTYKEIAKELRVSVKSVSRVVNGTFPLLLKRRLDDLSEDLNYLWDYTIKLDTPCPHCKSKELIIPVKCLNCGRVFYIDKDGKIYTVKD